MKKLSLRAGERWSVAPRRLRTAACSTGSLLHPARPLEASMQNRLEYDRLHAAPLRPSTSQHSNAAVPEKRLRVGYVSPDFRSHCQALFVTPLFRHHDHERFEIVCYSTTTRRDAVTDRLKRLADTWRDVADHGDEALAKRIGDDGIDILVDLTMHMSQNRALVFARKPAPVQICWLAYPGTTGNRSIDYRVSDRHIDPPGLDDAYYVEETLRLPDTFWCYDPQRRRRSGAAAGATERLCHFRLLEQLRQGQRGGPHELRPRARRFAGLEAASLVSSR